MLHDHRQQIAQRELRADFRAYRVVQACRGIALGLGGKKDDAKPEDIFPSLRALNFVGDEPDDLDDEDLAMSSFRQLRQQMGA